MSYEYKEYSRKKKTIMQTNVRINYNFTFKVFLIVRIENFELKIL